MGDKSFTLTWDALTFDGTGPPKERPTGPKAGCSRYIEYVRQEGVFII